MKHIVSIALFLLPIICFGQEMHFKYNKIYYDNTVYEKSEINSLMLKSPEAYRLYHKSLDLEKSISDYFLGAGLSLGVSVYLVRELKKAKERGPNIFLVDEDVYLVGSTLAISATSILLAAGFSNVQLSKRYMKRAVNYYNWEVLGKGQKVQSYIELKLTGNGLGLVYNL